MSVSVYVVETVRTSSLASVQNVTNVPDNCEAVGPTGFENVCRSCPANTFNVELPNVIRTFRPAPDPANFKFTVSATAADAQTHRHTAVGITPLTASLHPSEELPYPTAAGQSGEPLRSPLAWPRVDRTLPQFKVPCHDFGLLCGQNSAFWFLKQGLLTSPCPGGYRVDRTAPPPNQLDYTVFVRIV